jgi:acyl-CoA thioesterase
MLDIDVTLAARGRSITQGRVVGHVADAEILTVNAALGSRDLDVEGSWVERPQVPAPEDCEMRGPRFPGTESIMDRIDVRLADARAWSDIDGNPSPTGRSMLWARMPDLLDLSSGASLAILGDYVPFGIGQALGRAGGGSSLDNTLRVYRLVPTEWVLLDIRIHAVAHGFGHGVVHLWSEDGTLLATASQSTIVRLMDAETVAGLPSRAEQPAGTDPRP